MKSHTLAERGDVHGRLGIVEALSDVGHDPQVLADAHQAVEDELVRVLRHCVRSHARVKTVGAAHHADDDDAGIPYRRAKARVRHTQRENDARRFGTLHLNVVQTFRSATGQALKACTTMLTGRPALPMLAHLITVSSNPQSGSAPRAA